MIRKYKVWVLDQFGKNDVPHFWHSVMAWVNGQMSDGTLTWAFDGMEKDAVYICKMYKGKKRLFRQ